MAASGALGAAGGHTGGAAGGAAGGVTIFSGTFFPHLVQNFRPGVKGCPHWVQNAIR